MKLTGKIKRLKAAAVLHSNWFLYSLFGEEALSKEELKSLESYGKLPLKSSLDLAEKSYLLGRMRSLMKRSEYAEVTLDSIQKPSLTPVEKLQLEQIKLVATQNIKKTLTTILDVLLGNLESTIGEVISEANTKKIVLDEVKLAVLESKALKLFVSDLASKLGKKFNMEIKRVATTELHRAKISGTAQAIANKVDIYRNSDGPDSRVSVVPAPHACDDCKNVYLDNKGNPKVFVLKDLLAAGSNADPGVSHTRNGGLHVHWKTTISPLHPSCGCQLVYLPDGYGWQNSKLTLLNKSLFEMSLQKAVDPKEMSGTIKPPGPNGAAKEPGTPSLRGAPSPLNLPGPGRPKQLGGPPAPKGMSVGESNPSGSNPAEQVVDCPLGANCPDGGKHRMDSKKYAEHQAQAQATPQGREQAEEVAKHAAEQNAKVYNKQPHPHDVIVEHLTKGEIGSIKPLGDGQKGSTDAFKIAIVGNGSGLMKPPVIVNPGAFGTGTGTVPHGTNHSREVGAHTLSMGLGLTEHVPVTVHRSHDGTGLPRGEKSLPAPTGPTSVQHWQEDHLPHEIMQQKDGKPAKKLLDFIKTEVPKEHHEKLFTKLREIATLDIVMNNNDRHAANLVFSPDRSDIKAIDHGYSFGNGMQGHKNGIAHELHRIGKPLVIPEHLHTRLKNMSLGDVQRSLEGSGVEDWAAAQTWLRAKYATHLQDKLGHIPVDRLKGNMINDDGNLDVPHQNLGYTSFTDPTYKKEKEEGKTSGQLFDSFAKTYLLKASKDPSHPDHEDAKKALALKPVMGNEGMAIDPKQHRGSESHRTHWQNTKPYDLDYEAPDKEDYKLKGAWGGELPSAPARVAPEIPKTVPKKKKVEPPKDVALDKTHKEDVGSAKTLVKKSLYLADIHRPLDIS